MVSLAGLPPRPEEESAGASDGALIVLSLGAPAPGVWAVVQWQDGLGRWQDVQGWQGWVETLWGETHGKVWWVSPRDLGAGPFRWALFSNQQLVRASEPFYLPGEKGTTRVIPLRLEGGSALD